MAADRSQIGQHFSKTSIEGCSYSLVETDGVTSLNAVIFPAPAQTLDEELTSAFDRLDAMLQREQLAEGVTTHNVFIRDLSDQSAIEKRLVEYYGDHLPAITFIPQKPCDSSLAFLFEVSGIKSASHQIQIRRHSSRAVSVDIQGASFGFFGGILPQVDTTDAYPQSLSAFEVMRKELESHDYAVEELLRTWIYQGNIVRPEGETQRYKELNRARTDFFRDRHFLRPFLPQQYRGDVYPASTGIGAYGMSVTMGAATVKSARNLLTVPLENPDQTPAFDYGTVYSPQSPKFSRAMAVVQENRCMIYVSGTASIVDSETIHIGDAAGQTSQTLENIRRLISGENLRRHGIDGFDADLDHLALARVYVKRAEDFEKISHRVGELIAATPRTFTHADVCRDDLLVEIEGIVYCTKK